MSNMEPLPQLDASRELGQRRLQLVEPLASVVVEDYFNDISGAPLVEMIDTGEVDNKGETIYITRAHGQIPFGD
jgi:hypothetical protein